MEEKGGISDYRSKLDKTLKSPDLTNYEMIRTLVKNQITQSSDFQSEEWIENVVEKRSNELSNFLSMLRSASANDVGKSKSNEDSRGGWKVKQDTEDLRVMYREGPEGTPFHTLLAEGYVDGSIDVCMCISCESDLYERWWPKIAIPTFKVETSRCIQRIGIGEQISLVRMKVSWPLSSREALIHYFAFEYFQDGLVVVLLNSISDSETIDRNTHGFTRDGIPDAQDVVRIDVVGGFAIQKVTSDRSFFRTIANMDIKLDFVPPSFINFISRQLIGSGFTLYKKEVASVSKGDEKFTEALKGTIYSRVRKVLYVENTSTESPDQENLEKTTSMMLLEENSIEAFENNDAKGVVVSTNIRNVNEIQELEQEKEEGEITEKPYDDSLTNEIREKLGPEPKKEVFSLGVEEALNTLEKSVLFFIFYLLEKAISLFRNYNIYYRVKGIHKLGLNSVEESASPQAEKVIRENEDCAGSSIIGSSELVSHEPRISSASHSSRDEGSNSHLEETNQRKIIPTTRDEDLSTSFQTPLHSSTNQRTDLTVEEKIREARANVKSIKGDKKTKRKRKKSSIFCGLSFISRTVRIK